MKIKKIEALIAFWIERESACEDRSERKAITDTIASLEALRDIAKTCAK